MTRAKRLGPRKLLAAAATAAGVTVAAVVAVRKTRKRKLPFLK